MSTHALAVSRHGVPGTMLGAFGTTGAAGAGAVAWAIASAGTLTAGSPSGELSAVIAGWAAASGARSAAGAAAAVLNSPTNPTTTARSSTRTARMTTLHIRRRRDRRAGSPQSIRDRSPVDQAR